MAEIVKTLANQADWQAAIVQYLTDLTTTPGDALIDTPAAGRHAVLTNIVNMGSKPLAKGRFSRNVTLQNEIISQRIGYARGAWFKTLTSQAEWEGFGQKKENIDTATTPGDVVLAGNPAATVIDNMEYANDAAAQAAYVTSAPGSNIDEFDDDIFDLVHWGRIQANGGTVVESGGKIRFNTGGDVNKAAYMYDNDVLGSAQFDVYIKFNYVQLGIANPHISLKDSGFTKAAYTSGATWDSHSRVDIIPVPGSNLWLARYWDHLGARKYWNGAAWQAGSATFGAATLGVDYYVRYKRDATHFYFWILNAAKAVIYTLTPIPIAGMRGTTGVTYFTIGDPFSNAERYIVDALSAEGFYFMPGDLTVFSEDTIKVQGSYSLKVVANQTTSLNDYIEKDLGGGGTLDWSGWAILELYIRSTRGGGHIRFWFGEAAYNENSFDIYIEAADIWQRVYIDISDIIDANKNAVRYLAFEIINADVDTTYYLDAFTHPGYGYQRNTIDAGVVTENDPTLSVKDNIPANTSLIYVASGSINGTDYGPTRAMTISDDSGAVPSTAKRRYWRIGCIHNTTVWPTKPTQYELTLDWFTALVDLSLNELIVLPYQYAKVQVRLETNTVTSPALHSYTFTFINSYDLYVKKVRYKCTSQGIKVDMNLASGDPEPVNPVVALQQQQIEDRESQEVTHRSGIALCYGEMWVKNNAAATAIAIAGTYYQFLGFANNGPFNFTTPDHANDHIVIDVAGNYFIACGFHVEKTAGVAITIALEIRKNNGTVIYNNLHAHRALAGGAGDAAASIGITGILPSMVKTDTVELWLTNETNTNAVLVADANMAIHRVI